MENVNFLSFTKRSLDEKVSHLTQYDEKSAKYDLWGFHLATAIFSTSVDEVFFVEQQ